VVAVHLPCLLAGLLGSPATSCVSATVCPCLSALATPLAMCPSFVPTRAWCAFVVLAVCTVAGSIRVHAAPPLLPQTFGTGLSQFVMNQVRRTA